MVLSDWEIRMIREAGEFGLDPFDDALVQPSSVDLRLDRFARHARADVQEIDTRSGPDVLSTHFDAVEITDSGYALAPGDVLIGQTLEHIRVPGWCQGMIAQRSGLMRIGLHVSSSLLNPGYVGNLPCLIANIGRVPVRLYQGTPFCQLVLRRLSSPPKVLYAASGKYQGERRFEVSRIGEDVERWAPPSPRLANPAESVKFEVLVEHDDDVP